MPLTSQHLQPAGQGWGVWQITETEEELTYMAMESCPEEVVSPAKRLEWLAGRALIRTLTEACGHEYLGIRKDEFGKPFLKNSTAWISLSHSFPYAAAQLHPSQAVGIDLEQPKGKLLAIARRVLSAEEQAHAGDDVQKHGVYWCAKEALYKIYGKRSLIFAQHLAVQSFDLKEQGEIIGEIKVSNFHRLISLGYLIHAEYVLVYTNHSNHA